MSEKSSSPEQYVVLRNGNNLDEIYLGCVRTVGFAHNLIMENIRESIAEPCNLPTNYVVISTLSGTLKTYEPDVKIELKEV